MTFFSFYIFGLSRTHGALAPLSEQAPPGSHLTESVDAVSLAFIAHHHRRREFSELARNKYLKAIQQINKVLQIPERAIEDTTLQSVLLLDLYEKIANREHLDSRSWIAHVNGALALIKARGVRNFSSETARQLALRFITTSTISCNVACQRVPDALLDLRRSLDPYFERCDVKWRMGDLAISLINLKVDIREGKFASNSDICEAAWALDARFAALHSELSPFWKPARIMTAPGTPQAFSRYYDLYRDHFVTQGSNVFRSLRLVLHSMIQSYSRDSPTTGQAGQAGQACQAGQVSRQIINETCREICAAAPQFILKDARPENALPFTPLQILQNYAVLPPLHLAGQMSTETSVRTWVVEFMRYMAEAGEMEMASKTAELLETSSDVPYWSIYAMLGSYAFAV